MHVADRNGPLLADVDDGIRAAGGRVGLVEQLDVTDHDAVREAAERLGDRYGSMDVVTNVAGIATWARSARWSTRPGSGWSRSI